MFSHNKEFFSNKEHLGVILNTDGVPLFKSSQSTMWPVYLEIANFPPLIRFRFDNAITCGVWVGRSKPDMNILLKPILEAIDCINTLGFTFNSPDGIKTVRVKLLFGVFDLVSKAKVLNMKQFNGVCGCPTCVHPGEHRGSHIYLPDSSYPLRTLAGIEKAIVEDHKCGTIIDGIKDVSPLHNYVHLVDGVPTDYMHCVLEGVTKFLLTSWTSPKHSRKPFSIRKYLHQLDKALLKQTSPREFTHSTRSLIDMSYWKTSEYRLWLLFFSLPLIVNLLPPLYFHHFSLLVCAMHLLLSKEVMLTQCNAAEEMLGDFCALLPELYGECSCTLNAHSLIHIPHFVRLWGPCWTQSAFSFESHNGNLKRIIHSTRKVADQLSFSLDVRLTLQSLYHEIVVRESEDLISFLQYGAHAHNSMSKLRHGYAVGMIWSIELNDNEFREVKKLCPSASKQVKMFERLFFNNVTLRTIYYCNGDDKHSNAYCCYKNSVGKEAFGEIQKFVECPPIGTVAFLKPLQLTCSNILNRSGEPCREILDLYAEVALISQFVIQVHPISNVPVIAVSVENIMSNCILVTPSDPSTLYIVKLPNNYEHY